MAKAKNPYGYGLTKHHMNALRWANNKCSSSGGFFVVKEGWKRYIGMGRDAPTVSVRKLLEKDFICYDAFSSRLVSNKSTGPLEVYRFTERAVLFLAEHGGYKLPNGKVIEMTEEKN